MKNEAVVKKIVKALCAAKWEWTPSFCKKLGENLKPEDVDEVEGRSTFEFADDIDLSIYFDDDDLAQIDYIELTTDVQHDPERLSAKRYQQVLDQFAKDFEKTVVLLEEILGKPDFIGGPKNKGYLDEHESIRQAHWKIKNATLIAALKHEDREIPIRNCVVLIP